MHAGERERGAPLEVACVRQLPLVLQHLRASGPAASGSGFCCCLHVLPVTHFLILSLPHHHQHEACMREQSTCDALHQPDACRGATRKSVQEREERQRRVTRRTLVLLPRCAAVRNASDWSSSGSGAAEDATSSRTLSMCCCGSGCAWFPLPCRPSKPVCILREQGILCMHGHGWHACM